MDDRLKGWKEIADFLHIRERTAQRWEHALGLPVHRIETAKSAIVFASRREVDAWLQTAEGERARSEEFVGELPASDHESMGVDHQASGSTASLPVDSAPSRATAPREAFARPQRSGVASARPYTRPRSLLMAVGLVAVVALAWVVFHDRISRSGGDPVRRGDPAQLISGSSAKNSTASSSGRGSRRALALRLTLADGRTLRVMQPVGSLTTVSLTAHPSYALSAEITDGAIRIHVFRMQARVSDESKPLEELAVVQLRSGEKKQLPAPAVITAIEWLAPPSHPDSTS